MDVPLNRLTVSTPLPACESRQLSYKSVKFLEGLPTLILCRVTKGRCGLDRVHVEFPIAAAPLTTPDKAKSVVGMSRPVLTIKIVGGSRDAHKSARDLDHLTFDPMVNSRQSTRPREIRLEEP
jgi:hypothetical protein